MSSAVRSLDLAAQASAAADAAASRGGIRIAKLDDIEGINDAVALFREVWGPEDRDLIGSSTLRALAHADNYVFGAFVGLELVGAVAGFLGYHLGKLQLHSHILGVSPRSQGRNVGFSLKEHQRAWALSKGIDTITWTYDPLVSRNAYFNLAKLGGSVTAYYTSFYGLMNDDINGTDESDRVLIEWQLSSARAIQASSGGLEVPDLASLEREGAETALAVGDDEAPREISSNSDTLLVGIPQDIVQLRKSDPKLAGRWRLAVREVLGGALNTGYVTVGMTRSGFYVLNRVG